jgi:hypothetical protein
VANTSASPGSVQVTVIFEDGTSAQLPSPVSLAPNSRTTLPIRQFFPTALGRRFGTIVESLGASPAQIVVERAMYSNAVINGSAVVWAAGTNVVGTRLR